MEFTTGVAMLPREYGFVIILVAISGFLNFWMAAQVGKARKKYVLYLYTSIWGFGLYFLSDNGNCDIVNKIYRYKVALPAMYALESENENANLFNCVQVYFVYLLLFNINILTSWIFSSGP